MILEGGKYYFYDIYDEFGDSDRLILDTINNKYQLRLISESNDVVNEYFFNGTIKIKEPNIKFYDNNDKLIYDTEYELNYDNQSKIFIITFTNNIAGCNKYKTLCMDSDDNDA